MPANFFSTHLTAEIRNALKFYKLLDARLCKIQTTLSPHLNGHCLLFVFKTESSLQNTQRECNVGVRSCNILKSHTKCTLTHSKYIRNINTFPTLSTISVSITARAVNCRIDVVYSVRRMHFRKPTFIQSEHSKISFIQYPDQRKMDSASAWLQI